MGPVFTCTWAVLLLMLLTSGGTQAKPLHIGAGHNSVMNRVFHMLDDVEGSRTADVEPVDSQNTDAELEDTKRDEAETKDLKIMDAKSADSVEVKAQDTKDSKTEDNKDSKTENAEDSKTEDTEDSKTKDTKDSKTEDTKDSKTEDTEDSKTKDTKDSKTEDTEDSKTENAANKTEDTDSIVIGSAKIKVGTAPEYVQGRDVFTRDFWLQSIGQVLNRLFTLTTNNNPEAGHLDRELGQGRRKLGHGGAKRGQVEKKVSEVMSQIQQKGWTDEELEELFWIIHDLIESGAIEVGDGKITIDGEDYYLKDLITQCCPIG